MISGTFCGYGPPRALAFETTSNNPAGPGGLGAVLSCYCKSDLSSQIRPGASLRLCNGHGMGRDKPFDMPLDICGFSRECLPSEGSVDSQPYVVAWAGWSK